MSKRILVTFYFAAMIVLSGCAEFKNPLSDPKTSQADPSLDGLWADPEGETFFHIKASDEHHHEVLYVTSSIKGLEFEHLLLYPTTIGENHYVSVTMPKEHRSFKQASYMVIKYNVEGDLLKIAIVNLDHIRELIEQKQLPGFIKKGKCKKSVRLDNPEQLNAAQILGAQATNAMLNSLCRDTKQAPVVTASTAELRKLIQNAPGALVFEEKDSLHRVGTTKQNTPAESQRPLGAHEAS